MVKSAHITYEAVFHIYIDLKSTLNIILKIYNKKGRDDEGDVFIIWTDGIKDIQVWAWMYALSQKRAGSH
jgi:hypothetical protein